MKELAQVEPGYDVDTEGEGDILRVTRKPQNGKRIVTMDDDDSVPLDYRMITQESMDSYPLSYTVEQYGYHPKKVALSFDDGPDPEWTPKILDILKKYNVKGTFFMIGEVAEDNIGVMQRVYREGHEIGNHTWTHPDISEISNRQVDLELNLTERLFASEAWRAAALLPAALFHRPGAGHERSGRSRSTVFRASATSSSATRSTRTTGTSIRARPHRRSPTASFSRSRTWRRSRGTAAPSFCCTTAEATAQPRSPRCRC